MRGFGDEGVGEALEVALFLSRRPGRPRIGLRSGGPSRCRASQGVGTIRGSSRWAAEEGVARGQQLDLARGVPPGQDAAHPCLRVCRWRQPARSVRRVCCRRRRCSSLVWFSQQSRTGGVRAAPGGVARAMGLIHAFDPDFILGDGEVGPGARPSWRELVDAAFFNQTGSDRGRGRIEPEPGKPDE